MTLEDFEKELAQAKKEEKQKEKRHRREKEDSEDRRHHKHRHHHSSRHHDEEDEHRRKRRRRSGDDEKEGDDHHRRRHRHRSDEATDGSKAGADLERPSISELKRDSWMEAPSALDIDYVQRPQKPSSSPPKPNDLVTKFELKIHEKE